MGNTFHTLVCIFSTRLHLQFFKFTLQVIVKYSDEIQPLAYINKTEDQIQWSLDKLSTRLHDECYWMISLFN